MASDPLENANRRYRAHNVPLCSVSEYDIDTIFLRKYYEEQYEQEAEQVRAKRIVFLKIALRSLNPKQYDAVKLCILQGMKQSEAAQILHCSQQAVHRRLDRAIRNIRKIANL